MGESASTDHVKRVERELAKEDSLLANMIQQAPGMLGMAFMFIITILLGIWLQPWFDAAGLQAFGESGSTEVRWIAQVDQKSHPATLRRLQVLHPSSLARCFSLSLYTDSAVSLTAFFESPRFAL